MGAEPWNCFTKYDANIQRALNDLRNSEFAAGRAETLFPSVPKRLRVVRPGMDLSKLQSERVSGRRVADVRASWGVAAHERVVLAPSRLAPGRGQQTLIEAAALIKQRGLDDVIQRARVAVGDLLE